MGYKLKGEDYKGYFIEEVDFGFFVFFCGDEIYFKTKEDAKRFIDEIDEIG